MGGSHERGRVAGDPSIGCLSLSSRTKDFGLPANLRWGTHLGLDQGVRPYPLSMTVPCQVWFTVCRQR